MFKISGVSGCSVDFRAENLSLSHVDLLYLRIKKCV